MSIVRIDSGKWLSRAVVFGDLVFLSGMTADDVSQGIRGQTEQVLKKIDRYLAEAGTNKSLLLSAQIWLHDIGSWEEMTEVWMAWIDKNNPPARAAVGSSLGHGRLVEIMVTAAKR